MFSEDGKLVWAAQYRTWGAINKIWQADNDNDIRGPYPPPIRGNLAFKYDTLEAQAAQTCPIRFQGQWEDTENGLYYNRYRYYDPLAAQYISPDPIGLAGGLRSNGYVHNPNAWVDPCGLAKRCCKEVAQQIIDDAKNEKIRIVEDSHHGDHGFDKEMLQKILSDPDAVYSVQNGKKFVFYKDGNVVITRGTTSGSGNVITAYGSSGTVGKRYAKRFGGSAEDEGPAVTIEQIVNGGDQYGMSYPPGTLIMSRGE